PLAARQVRPVARADVDERQGPVLEHQLSVARGDSRIVEGDVALLPPDGDAQRDEVAAGRGAAALGDDQRVLGHPDDPPRREAAVARDEAPGPTLREPPRLEKPGT